MMRGIGNSVRAVAGVVALLIVVPPSAEAQQVQTQPAKQTLKQTSKQASKQTLKRPVAAKKLTLNQPAAEKKSHRLVLQVNVNDPATMNLALNNATNVAQYYKDRDEKVAIEVITFGPGLHMLRADTSPVKARIEALALSSPEISFNACGNTRENMSKAESKEIPLISEAKVVKSGVVRVMELQEQGWTYVRP
jgi:intracellular sulfur oxidation DsrE/DsrF family protein